MRRKPVSRDEVHFNGRTITTAPVDAVRGTEYRWGNPIMRLWAPLLRELVGSQLGSFVVGPDCRQCGWRFWRHDRSSGVFCSDHCAALARRAKYAATQGAARAAARVGRKCENETCGKPLKAARSTMRYCSVRCRVAAFRGA